MSSSDPASRPAAVYGATPAALAATWFDGQSARGMPAYIRLQGDMLEVSSQRDGRTVLLSRTALAQVRWPERTRGGSRVAFLPDGASLHGADPAAWDEWVAQHIHPQQAESLVVQAQQSWRNVAIAFVLLLGVLWGLYVYGLPWAARGVVALLPHQVDVALGDTAFASIDGEYLKPSKLPAARQQAIAQRLQQAASAQYQGRPPPFKLEFRSAPMIGPNAFALPGGTMVLLDELVDLAQNDDMVLAVLGHELGHVAHRDGLRHLVQASALGVIVSIAFGDYGSFLATAPAVLLHLGYSRKSEHEADVHAVQFMRAGGISPEVMAQFFEKIRDMPEHRPRSGASTAGRPDAAASASSAPQAKPSAPRHHQGDDSSLLGIAFSSHPATAERIAFFRKAAQ